MGRGSVIIVAAIALSSAVACSENDKPPPSDVFPTSVAFREEKPSWRKPRYISVEKAIARLQRHVKTPIILPRQFPGMPNLRRWLADPKYLDWDDVINGERVGGLVLRRPSRVLSFQFGYATFDGCGGDLAIETNVLGQPALLNLSSGHLWSSLIWPVKAGEIAGRYGISGTLEGWQVIELAESMELARLEATKRQTGC